VMARSGTGDQFIRAVGRRSRRNETEEILLLPVVLPVPARVPTRCETAGRGVIQRRDTHRLFPPPEVLEPSAK